MHLTPQTSPKRHTHAEMVKLCQDLPAANDAPMVRAFLTEIVQRDGTPMRYVKNFASAEAAWNDADDRAPFAQRIDVQRVDQLPADHDFLQGIEKPRDCFDPLSPEFQRHHDSEIRELEVSGLLK